MSKKAQYFDGGGMQADRAENLVELLQWRAVQNAQRTAYTFLEQGERPEASLTFGELHLQASRLAAHLQAVGLPGERAVLLYPPGLDYIVAFFACLYSGMIAVPAYPPSNGRHMPRLQALIADCDAAVLLCTQNVADTMRHFSDDASGLREKHWLITDRIDGGAMPDWMPRLPESHDPAFLQYTSGSTGHAKGVIVSHANLIANQRSIQRYFGHNEQSTVVGWLPLYHDMGLIGNVMQPLYCGSSAVLMSPMAFLEKPLRWLQAVSGYRAHTSGGPNFAYELCVNKITDEEKQGLDLSRWRLAFNGAEPVNASTLDRFSAAFEQCGFERRAFYPCYGLAEATLFAAGGDSNLTPTVAAFCRNGLEQGRARPAQNGVAVRHLVACGRIDRDEVQRIRIADPESGAICGDERIGEIQLAGPSISPGYWRNTDTDASTFIEDSNGRWLKTGDLGFIAGGELFVSGRLKDLIIVRGRNYYPQDLEQAVESATDAVNPGSVAAFSLCGDSETVIVVAELKRHRLRQTDYRAEFNAIRSRLTEDCGIQADAVLLVPPGGVFKTSSGKVKRSACREAYERQTLKIIAADRLNEGVPLDGGAVTDRNGQSIEVRRDLLATEESEAAAILSQLLAEKTAQLAGLRPDEVDTAQALSALGLDSLKAVELKYYIDELLLTDMPVEQLLGDRSLVECAKLALQRAETGRNGQRFTEPSDSGRRLSYGQQALWTASRIDAGSALYNMAVAVRIRAELDCDALQAALDNLFEQHEQLRSTFRADRSDGTVRVQAAELQPRLIVCHFADERERSEAVSATAGTPFDLARGPLLRAGVFSLAGGDHVLLFCAHHLVVDYRSLSILIEQFKCHYFGMTPDRTETSSAYAAYLAWQSDYLAGEQAALDREYWHRRLSGELPKTVLPADKYCAALPAYRGASETLVIEPAMLARLKQLAARQQTTLYTLLLAVFKTLLFRYGGQRDIIVGSPTLGRPKREFTGTVGYFVNPVALRSHPAGDRRFCDYLKEVNTAVLEALAHQYYPHALLVEELQPERIPGEPAFFRTWFVLQSGGSSDSAELALGLPGAALDWNGLPAESYALSETPAPFDLSLLMAETGQGLAASFQYRSGLLSRTAVQRLAGHFITLLRAIVADPAGRLAQLPLLSSAERDDFAVWNAVASEWPQHTVVDAFEAVVRERSDEAALVYRDRTLGYAELNAEANRLAHLLIARGAGPESRVALCIRRSPELLVGILAILKAGAVYVPIDPSYPAERLNYVLQDAACAWLLTGSDLPEESALSGTATINLHDRDAYAAYSEDNPRVPLHRNHAAYVIYTSGSTGKPKGVVVGHANLMHSTHARNVYYRHKVACFLLLPSFAFDSSVAGIFWTLSQGGCLCLPDDADIKDPAALAALIENRRVSHLLALPSLYELLLEHAPPAMLQSLTEVIVAGEVCASSVTQRHFCQMPSTALYNEYGPTEATVWSTVHAVSEPCGTHSVPIGNAIANMRIHIVDAELNELPAGVSGELLVGGAGITRGYHGRAGLTAERFVPDPFRADGGRLYRTGDRVRYLADGGIEFLGRFDDQVKIRGYRIELGEIESCLLRHPSIKSAAVAVREESPGNKRLVAYLVGDPGIDAAGLKAHIKHCLPEYMVPSAWSWLEALPLNANGKLDRKALLRLEAPGADSGQFVAPRDEAEQAVADIWREVLGVDRLGVHDDFFELGGHSLAGVQVAAKIQELFDIEVPVDLLFEATTVASFVDRMVEYRAAEAFAEVE